MVYKVICILCASSIPFLYSIDGDFVFDDSEAIISNNDVTSSSWMDAFRHDFWGTDIESELSHKSYRPLTILSFKLNYYLSNKVFDPVQFKLTNVFFHITCCYILWLTFESILDDVGMKTHKPRPWHNDIAFLATVLFSVHPVHVEAISGVVGRADVLAGNTFFLAYLFYKKAMVSVKLSLFYLLLAIILATMSMLFKENGVTVLGFCLFHELFVKFNPKKPIHAQETKAKDNKYLLLKINFILRIFCTVMAIIFLIYGRWMVMGGTTPEFKAIDNPAAYSKSVFAKIATYNYIYFLNLLLLIWPQWLCYDWSMGCVPLLKNERDYRILFIVLIYLYGFFTIVSLFRQQNKGKMKRLTIVALALAVISFLPASNILYPVGFVIAERILYIPSAGYCLLITIGLHRLIQFEKRKSYKITIKLFCLLIFTFALRSWQRAEEWRNEYQLFVSGLSVCPLNAKVHYNVAKVADANRQTDWALEEYKKSIRLYPKYYQALNNYANLLKNKERYSEAELYLKTAVSIKNDFPAAWMNLGIVLAKVQRFEEAESAYRKALDYKWNYPDCLYNLGNMYIEMNKTEEALQHLHRAVKLNSTHVLAWTNLLALLDNTGQLERSLEYIPKALMMLPDSPPVNFAIANIYGKMDRFADAEKHFKKSITLFDGKVQALYYANLGVLYHRWRKFLLAEEMYKKALAIDPAFQSARKNLENLKGILHK
ncbi:protein O-mannosyl-transferase TMTC4-like [Pectinophora gossypiella]|nr:protein O-mannosyl-transferase TMTC4-like [Pectinophora gossypiella]